MNLKDQVNTSIGSYKIETENTEEIYNLKLATSQRRNTQPTPTLMYSWRRDWKMRELNNWHYPTLRNPFLEGISGSWCQPRCLLCLSPLQKCKPWGQDSNHWLSKVSEMSQEADPHHSMQRPSATMFCISVSVHQTPKSGLIKMLLFHSNKAYTNFLIRLPI